MGLNKIKKISLGIYIAGSISLAALAGNAVYAHMGGPIRNPGWYSEGIFIKKVEKGPYESSLEVRTGTKIGVGALTGLYALIALLSPWMIYEDIQRDKYKPQRQSRGFVDNDSRTSGEHYPFNS